MPFGSDTIVSDGHSTRGTDHGRVSSPGSTVLAVIESCVDDIRFSASRAYVRDGADV